MSYYYNRPSHTNQQIHRSIGEIEAILNNRGTPRTTIISQQQINPTGSYLYVPVSQIYSGIPVKLVQTQTQNEEQKVDINETDLKTKNDDMNKLKTETNFSEKLNENIQNTNNLIDEKTIRNIFKEEFQKYILPYQNELRNEIKNQKNNIIGKEEFETEIGKNNKDLNEVKDNLKRIERENKRKENDFVTKEQHEQEIQELNEKIRKLESNLNNLNSNLLGIIKENIENFHVDINKQENEKFKEKLLEREKNYVMKNVYDNKIYDIELTLKDNNETHLNKYEFKKKIEEIENKLKLLSKNNNNNKDSINKEDLEKYINYNPEEIKLFTVQIEKIEDNLKKIEDNNNNNLNDISELKLKIHDLENQLDKFNDLNDKIDKVEKDFSNRTSANETRLMTLSGSFGDSGIGTIKSDIEKMKKRIESIENKNPFDKNYDKDIDDINNKINDLENNIKNSDEDIKNKIGELENKIGENVNDDDIKNKIEELENMLNDNIKDNDNQNRINDLEKKFEAQTEYNNNINEFLEKLNNDVENIKSKNNDNKDLDNDNSIYININNDINNLKKDIDALKTNQKEKDLNNDLENLKKDIESLKNNQNDNKLDYDLDNLKNDIEAIKINQNDNKLNEDLTNLKKDIEELQINQNNDLDKIKQDIETLKSYHEKDDDKNNDLNNIKNDIETLKSYHEKDDDKNNDLNNIKNDIITLKSYQKNKINIPDNRVDEEDDNVILKNKKTTIQNKLINSNLELIPYEAPNFIIESDDEIENEDNIKKKTLRAKPIIYTGYNDVNEYIVNTQENDINNKETDDKLINEKDLNEEKEKSNFDINEIDIENSEESKKEEKICGCVSREEDLFRKGWTFIKISSYVAYKQSSREEKKKFKKWKKVCGLKDEQNSMSQEDIDVKNQSEKSEIFMNQDEL